MPSTRNMTRTQVDPGRVRASTRRHRDENDKENMGGISATTGRSQARNRVRAAPLGPSNILGAHTPNRALGEKTRTASRSKGKPTKAPLKQKKMPLQDITRHFVPAPEPANRGEEAEGINNDSNVDATPGANRVVVTVPLAEPSNSVAPLKFNSPLPPSSPPSEWVASPSLPKQSIPAFFDDLHYPSQPTIPQETFDPWSEFDHEQELSQQVPSQASSNSDPFGFVSLERKLKAERELVASLDPQHDLDEEDEVHVLVADTSSPRPVRRLRRTDSRPESVDVPLSLHAVLPVPTSLVPPPSPHKDKLKRRRLSSHEGHDIFSPCASSIESSPSPTKSSARKRPAPDMGEDALDAFNEELDRSYEVEKTLKKARSSKQVLELEAEDKVSNDDSQTTYMKLRPREKRQSAKVSTEEDQLETKQSRISTKSRVSKKAAGHARSAGKKKEKPEATQEEDGEALEEKWQRERQERIEYFKRLEEYHVEKEDVYLI